MKKDHPLYQAANKVPVNTRGEGYDKLATLRDTPFDPSQLPGAGNWGGPPEQEKDVTEGGLTPGGVGS